jgi:hypothetical protein
MAETIKGAIGTSKPIAIAGESRRAYEKRVGAWAKAQAQADWQAANPQAAKTGKAYTWASVPARWADLDDAGKLTEMVGQAVYFTTGVQRVKAIILAAPCKGDAMLNEQKRALTMFDALGVALKS